MTSKFFLFHLSTQHMITKTISFINPIFRLLFKDDDLNFENAEGIEDQQCNTWSRRLSPLEVSFLDCCLKMMYFENAEGIEDQRWNNDNYKLKWLSLDATTAPTMKIKEYKYIIYVLTAYCSQLQHIFS